MLDELYLKRVDVRKDLPAFREGYFSKLPALCSLDSLAFHRPVTMFVGENATGKSTLLEGIAVAWGFNPEGGSKNFSFRTRDTHSQLFRCLKLIKGPAPCRDGFFLRSESFYNVSSQVDELGLDLREYGGASLHSRSHGESFLSLVLSRFRGHGLYLLDEPEAALSPTRQLTLLCAMHELVKNGSQLILATHSPILMAYPQAALLKFDERGIHPTEYKKTEHYQVSRAFLEKPQKMLRVLFSEQEDEV